MADNTGAGNGPVMTKDRTVEKAGRARRAGRWVGDKLTSAAAVLPGGRWTVKGQARREEHLEMERQKRKEMREKQTQSQDKKPSTSTVGNQSGAEIGEAPEAFSKQFGDALMRGYDLAPSISDPVVMNLLRTASAPQFYEAIISGSVTVEYVLKGKTNTDSINLKTALENKDKRYESSMKEVRQQLADKLQRGSFNGISTHELDIIFKTMAGTCYVPGTNVSIWSNWESNTQNPTEAFVGFLEMVAKDPEMNPKHSEGPGKFIASVIKFLVEKSSLVSDVDSRVKNLQHREGLIDETYFYSYLSEKANIDGFLGLYKQAVEKVLRADSSDLIEVSLSSNIPGMEESLVLPGFGLSEEHAAKRISELHDVLRKRLLSVTSKPDFKKVSESLESPSASEELVLSQLNNAIAAGLNADTSNPEAMDSININIKRQAESVLPKTEQELDSTITDVEKMLGEGKIDNALGALDTFERIHLSGFEKEARSLLEELKAELKNKTLLLYPDKEMTDEAVKSARNNNEASIKEILSDLRGLELPDRTRTELAPMLVKLQAYAGTNRGKSQDRAIKLIETFIATNLPSVQKLDNKKIQHLNELKGALVERKNLGATDTTEFSKALNDLDSQIIALVSRLGYGALRTEKIQAFCLAIGDEARTLAILENIGNDLNNNNNQVALNVLSQLKSIITERKQLLASGGSSADHQLIKNNEKIKTAISVLKFNPVQRELKSTIEKTLDLCKIGRYALAQEEMADLELRMKTPLSALAKKLLKPYETWPEYAKERMITQDDWIVAFNTFRGKLDKVEPLPKIKKGWAWYARTIAKLTVRGVGWLFGVLPAAYHKFLMVPVWNRLKHFPQYRSSKKTFRQLSNSLTGLSGIKAKLGYLVTYFSKSNRELRKALKENSDYVRAKKEYIENHRQTTWSGLGWGTVLAIPSLWVAITAYGAISGKDYLVDIPGLYSPTHGEVFRWPWHKKSFLNPNNLGYHLSDLPKDPATIPTIRLLPQDLAKASDHALNVSYSVGNVLPGEAKPLAEEEKADAQKRARKMAQARMEWLREDNIQPSPWQKGVAIPATLTFLEEMSVCLAETNDSYKCKNEISVLMDDKKQAYMVRNKTDYQYVLKMGDRVEDKTVVDRFVNELMALESKGQHITLAYLRENIPAWYAKGYLWRTVDAKFASAARIQQKENADFLSGNPVFANLVIKLANLGASPYYFTDHAPDKFVSIMRTHVSKVLGEKDVSKLEVEKGENLAKLLNGSGLDNFLHGELQANYKKPDPRRAVYFNWVNTYLTSADKNPLTLLENLGGAGLLNERNRLVGRVVYVPLFKNAVSSGLVVEKREEYKQAQIAKHRNEVAKTFRLTNMEDIDFVRMNPNVYLFLDTLNKARKGFVLEIKKANQFVPVLREHIQKGGSINDFDPNLEPIGKMVPFAVNLGYIIDHDQKAREDIAKLTIAQKLQRIEESKKDSIKLNEKIKAKEEERKQLLMKIGASKAEVERFKKMDKNWVFKKNAKDHEQQALHEGLLEDFKKQKEALDLELDTLRGEANKAYKQMVEKTTAEEFWTQNKSTAEQIEGIIKSVLNNRGRKRFASNNPTIVGANDSAKEADKKITAHVLNLIRSELDKEAFKAEHGFSMEADVDGMRLKFDLSKTNQLKKWITMVLSS